VTNKPIQGISNSEKRRILFQTVEKLKELPRGWDSYDGVPMREDVATKVYELGLALIPKETSFHVIPLSDGGAQIEWHRDGIDVEIYVGAHEEANDD
jgi:hypothetical protein